MVYLFDTQQKNLGTHTESQGFPKAIPNSGLSVSRNGLHQEAHTLDVVLGQRHRRYAYQGQAFNYVAFDELTRGPLVLRLHEVTFT